MSTLIEISEIIPGDVLLCFDSSTAEEIFNVTGSRYSHAGICIAESIAAESCVNGVKKSEISKIVSEYECVAVFRPHPRCWTSGRLQILNKFIDQAIERKAKFNFQGFRNFDDNAKDHEYSITEKLDKFFKGTLKPESPVKESYFCSELVISAFYIVGILSDGAAIFYDPKAQSPAKISKDPTFGLFLGHIRAYGDFSVPLNDEFLTVSRFHDVYPNRI